MTRPRAGSEVHLLDRLPPLGEYLLDGPEGRHALVRRVRPGAELLLADGRGGWAGARVLSTERDGVRLHVERAGQENAPALRVTLVQAVLKGDAGTLAVDLATEAGVDRIVPWQASRCVARWDGAAEPGVKRWRATARAATKQARRTFQPEVAEPVSTDGVCALIGRTDAALLLHESASTGIAAAALPDAGEMLLIVGPEGGCDDGEVDRLTAAGATAVRLGPQVLRASAAAAVALGALGALTSRWAEQ